MYNYFVSNQFNLRRFFQMVDELHEPNNLIQQDEKLSFLPSSEMAAAFDTEDYSLPRWKIDKQSGDFTNTVSGEVKSIIRAIIIKADKSRFFWPEKFNKDNQPVCYSVDGVRPEDQSKKQRYGVKTPNGGIICAGCPAAQWVGDEKPKCSISYNYLLLDLDTGLLSVLNLSRARAKTARAINSIWRLQGVRTPIVLTTVFERGDAGDYYGIEFTAEPSLTDWMEYARQMLSSKSLRLTGTLQAAIEETHEPEQVISPNSGRNWQYSADGKTRVDLVTGEVEQLDQPTAAARNFIEKLKGDIIEGNNQDQKVDF